MGTTSGVPGDDPSSPKLLPAELTIDALFDAYFDCRKRKRNTINQLAFELDLEGNLVGLWRDLTEGRYRIGRSLAFVVTHPKVREIWAADFRDRVVHHVIYNALFDRFSRRFIRDSYACIPGRGNHDGRDRVTAFARSITHGWSKPAHYLKIDVANFFNSIDRRILLDIVLARTPEPWLRDLITQVVLHDPRKNAFYKSSLTLFDKVPRHKSLRLAADHIGLPIGNLTSQFFANVYMNEVDQFVKRTLKVKYYGRYVDDMILMHESPYMLRTWCAGIDRFLNEKLGLKLHPNKVHLNLVHHGINFTGFIIKPGRCYLRRSTVAGCKHKIRTWEKKGCPVDKESLQALGQSVNSYLGMLRHVDGYNARRAICDRLNTLFVHPDVNCTKITVAA